jgi:predicted flap endonuclease-1-like 5' DNA nuclease
MYDELVATGKVEKTLPEDDRVVREAYAKEVLPARLAEQARARDARIDVPTVIVSAALTPAGQPDAGARSVGSWSAPEASPAIAAKPVSGSAASPAAAAEPASLSQLTPRAAPPRPASGSLLDRLPPSLPLQTATAATDAIPDAPAPELAAAVARTAAVNEVRKAVAAPPVRDSEPRAQRLYLAPTDGLEAAPSIGPKTAERLAVAGLHTIADLLAADPDVVAAQAGTRSIDAETVRDWQAQARLVSTIPGLRGTGAQLLVGAGYRSLETIASADAGKLCADVLAYAATAAGNRILRDGQPPDIERIKSWCESAKAVARAA